MLSRRARYESRQNVRAGKPKSRRCLRLNVARDQFEFVVRDGGQLFAQHLYHRTKFALDPKGRRFRISQGFHVCRERINWRNVLA